MHLLRVSVEVCNARHELLKLFSFNISDNSDEERAVEIYETHVAELRVALDSALKRSRVEQPLVVELYPYVAVHESACERINRDVRIGSLAYA